MRSGVERREVNQQGGDQSLAQGYELPSVGLVAVPVMEIRIVRMMMHERLVTVLMSMGLRAIPDKGVRVLMMGVVPWLCASAS